MRRDGAKHVIVETEAQLIKRFSSVDFRKRNPEAVVMYKTHKAIAKKKAEKFKRQVAHDITATTPASASRAQVTKYPDNKQWD